MKKILIQLDTDEHPSTFDAIVAHDAGVDALLRYGGIEPDVVKGLVQSAFFTRGPKDLASMAVWFLSRQILAWDAIPDGALRLGVAGLVCCVVFVAIKYAPFSANCRLDAAWTPRPFAYVTPFSVIVRPSVAAFSPLLRS